MIRRHLRDLGEHLMALSDAAEYLDTPDFRSAIPLAAADHKPGGIDDLQYLCRLAKEEYTERKRRNAYIDGDLLGEPVWDMLLDLFVCYALDRKVAVSSVSYAADIPSTTALRYIAIMEERGLIVRKPDKKDKRRSWIELTPSAFRSISGYLAERGKRRRADGVSLASLRA